MEAPPANRHGSTDHPGPTDPAHRRQFRFDYEDLDAGRGLLFIAHLGAGQVIEVDMRAGKVVRTLDGLDDVHGVIIVPQLHRVFATTRTDELVPLDEDTGRELGRAPTGAYPDGLAYDPETSTVWTPTRTTAPTSSWVHRCSARGRRRARTASATSPTTPAATR